MQTKSVIIKNVAIHHPERKENNQVFIDHFNKKGQEISNLLSSVGRNERYISGENDNSLSLAIEASKKVLEYEGLKGEDIDLIVFSSGTPEYLYPSNSVIIHHEIEGKSSAIVFDLNTACVGMVVAVENVSRYMMNNPSVNRALVVGGEQWHRFTRDDNAPTYAGFGDGSAAIILEKTETENTGFIDSVYYTNSEFKDKILFPACGLSNILNPNVKDYDKKLLWEVQRDEKGFLSTVSSIKKVLEKNNVNKESVKHYLFSQLSLKNIIKVSETLEVDLDKFALVGDKFGYTGTSSPFIALEQAIREGKIQRGDYIIFWSLGAGITSCTLLFKF